MDGGVGMEDRPPRRPWALIAACLVLVVLAAVLWVKWSGSRRDAARLERELTRVYKEAEDLRLQAALAQERMGKLEREVRALHAERDRQAKPPEEKTKSAKPPARR
jgi:type VI protein secretion system component VasK